MRASEILKDKIDQAKTVRDIERLDRIADALAAQALGRTEILIEQLNLER